MGIAHLIPCFGKSLKFLRVDVAFDRQMMSGWLQILPKRQQADAVIAQILHNSFNLADFFAQPQHESGLGGNVLKPFFEIFQKIKGVLIVRTRPDALIEAWHGLEVMIEYIW